MTTVIWKNLPFIGMYSIADPAPFHLSTFCYSVDNCKA
jgi:hypothetical protein